MKLLIVYTHAGYGHRRAAEAIYESLDSNLKKESRLVDILDFTPHLFKLTYSKGYIFLSSKLAWLWSFFYWVTDLKILELPFKLIRRFLNYSNTIQFQKFIKDNAPQVILSTHFLPNEVLSNLKQSRLADFFLITLVTDYAFHSFWKADEIDRYVVALNCVKEILVKKGIEEDKILPLGIPVDKRFFDLKSREEAAKIIGVAPDRFTPLDSRHLMGFTTLLVTGTIGLNSLERIVNLLKDEVQTIIICGNNKRLLQRLKKLDSKNLFAFGLIDNMDDFLSSSDIIITKAGGLTIAECLVAKIPMCFLFSAGGQEAANIDVLTSLGCAIYEQDLNSLARKVLEFRDNPQTLAKMRQDIERISPLDPNGQIISLIKEHVQ